MGFPLRGSAQVQTRFLPPLLLSTESSAKSHLLWDGNLYQDGEIWLSHRNAINMPNSTATLVAYSLYISCGCGMDKQDSFIGVFTGVNKMAGRIKK
jgi:hypothetical protein